MMLFMLLNVPVLMLMLILLNVDDDDAADCALVAGIGDGATIVEVATFVVAAIVWPMFCR